MLSGGTMSPYKAIICFDVYYVVGIVLYNI